MIKSNTERLSWDSEFFAREIGTVADVQRVTADEMVGFDLLCKKVRADDYRDLDRLTELGFVVVEGELDFIKVLPLNATSQQNYRAFIAGEADLPGLIPLAETSYTYSRFRTPWFTQEENSRFYAAWVRNAVLRQFDDICLLIKANRKVKGFISLKKDDSLLRIGLISVSLEYRGQNVAQQLMELAEDYALAHQCNQIAVATQISNMTAVKLYLRAGYLISQTGYWLYKG